jgi:sugar lactone lactonase YvrE
MKAMMKAILTSIRLRIALALVPAIVSRLSSRRVLLRTGRIPGLVLGAVCGLAVLLSACGREPSRALRQGQLPVYDFPLYLSESSVGTVWKYNADRTRVALATGLNNPLGLATDRFNHLYVVEQGAGRLLKYSLDSGNMTVVATGLVTPTSVAVDSSGEAFVAQDTPHNVIRASNLQVVANHYTRPTALTIGVDDTMIVGDYATNTVSWGAAAGGPSASVGNIQNLAIDGMGRVYVAEGSASGARVWRYHQKDPGGAQIVADLLQSPSGLAVDPVGNIYIVEKGQSRITLVSQDAKLYTWVSGLSDPDFLAFTQY